MTAQSPDKLEIVHGENPEWSIIWLHGLGADGHDFEPVVRELALPASVSVRFVFPHAPYRAVTINAGMRMRAWYDIRAMDIVSQPDVEGVEASSKMLAALVEAEVERGVEPGRIILAGFSQGGAIALHTAFELHRHIAGVIALSTYLPLPDDVDLGIASDNHDVPIFMGHGLFDPIVPVALGEAAKERLLAGGFDVTWQTYPMPHAVSPDEIAAIRAWLLDVTGVDAEN
ncbi:MAG: carboxylesterase [Proteobacteria bacterium]|nr:MAG: carboxylesterase [Pseudomonadota bacterium]